METDVPTIQRHSIILLTEYTRQEILALKILAEELERPKLNPPKKRKFERNTGACEEHRRKHQKCPLDCRNRVY